MLADFRARGGRIVHSVGQLSTVPTQTDKNEDDTHNGKVGIDQRPHSDMSMIYFTQMVSIETDTNNVY